MGAAAQCSPLSSFLGLIPNLLENRGQHQDAFDHNSLLPMTFLKLLILLLSCSISHFRLSFGLGQIPTITMYFQNAKVYLTVCEEISFTYSQVIFSPGLI